MNQKVLVTIITIILSVFICSTQVYAGNINANEQTVIDYYNKTFTYEGKNYVATEAAKQSVYNKMMQDDVDLTAAEAKTAIRQANANIKKGISDGILVEVKSEDDTENQKGTENQPQGETETQQAGNDDNSDDGQEGTSQDGTAPGNHTGNGDGQAGGNSKGGDGTSSDKNKPVNPGQQKDVDVKKLTDDTKEEGQDHGFIYSAQDSDDPLNLSQPITAEQYLSGKITVVSKEGKLVFQSELPIKNTGYASGPVGIYAGAFFVIMLTAVIRGLKCREKMN